VPDWSYQPFLKPLGALLPADARRMAALRGLQFLGAAPGGSQLIEVLGQMQPEGRLRTPACGKPLISPVGLGGGVDPDGLAIGALARFGVGFVEVGPYALGIGARLRIVAEPLRPGRQLGKLAARLRRCPPEVSVWLRLAVGVDDERLLTTLDQLLSSAERVDAVCLTLLDGDGEAVGGSHDRWRSLASICREYDRRLMVDAVAADLAGLEPALRAGASGVAARTPGISLSALRRICPAPLVVMADTGASSPREIVAQLDVGADLVAVDVGLLEAGPGLAKRANEHLLALRVGNPAAAAPVSLGLGWPWAFLLGAGMALAGFAVLLVGLTRVMLPYDETFLGVTVDRLPSLNPRLLAFMQHDRITLAGTLVSIGILYASLAWNGLRQGQRWARDALTASGAVGFTSLFLFLGFHYVDPLHVVLSVALFPLFLLGAALPLPPSVPPLTDLDNDRAWRLGLMGQLLLVGLGAGLTAAGLTISAVGITRVFVFSDLQFLQTTAATLGSANAHLLPLIAHDRAGFGGALASDGVAVLLLALWGFRRGAHWVWWTLLVAGMAGLIGALYAHLAVGYLEFGHLLPVGLSALVFGCGLAFSSAYLLTRRPPRL
jgi:dihydroorotate dehydrogenase